MIQDLYKINFWKKITNSLIITASYKNYGHLLRTYLIIYIILYFFVLNCLKLIDNIRNLKNHLDNFEISICYKKVEKHITIEVPRF